MLLRGCGLRLRHGDSYSLRGELLRHAVAHSLLIKWLRHAVAHFLMVKWLHYGVGGSCQRWSRELVTLSTVEKPTTLSAGSNVAVCRWLGLGLWLGH